MTSGPDSVRERYDALVARGRIDADPAQLVIVERFAALQRALAAPPARGIGRWFGRRADERPQGIYLWGGVGRGKTFLMDLFFASLAGERKKRIHFHRMMREIHERLRQADRLADPLAHVADGIAAEVDVLCFDEFFVSDIGDAMILGRLLGALFERGVVIVTTSNSHPHDLYRDGLQRARFLPAIDAIEANLQVLGIGGDTDYRLRLFEAAGTWLVPADAAADARLARVFDDVASGDVVEAGSLSVNGRPIACRRQAKGVAWFDFGALCDGPRSQDDYIELARWYPAVIVSGIPALGRRSEDAARRFVALIDEFYDRKVKLVASAAVGIGDLYSGRRVAFEFQRTASRLIEMQTSAYLHAEHQA